MKITLKGKNNVYEQIVNEYKRFIELGIIKQNEKLPSCRVLAKELGINPNTVVRAYSVLEQEGYITSLPKKGAFVIYSKTNCTLNHRNHDIKEYLSKYKNILKYEEMLEIINQLYGRDQ